MCAAQLLLLRHERQHLQQQHPLDAEVAEEEESDGGLDQEEKPHSHDADEREEDEEVEGDEDEDEDEDEEGGGEKKKKRSRLLSDRAQAIEFLKRAATMGEVCCVSVSVSAGVCSVSV